jgi:hypothetical protein
MLAISDVAASDARKADWIERAKAASQAIDAGQELEASKAIQALGKEVSDALKKQRETEGPLRDWRKAYSDCLKQANGLHSAMVRNITDAGEEENLPAFENGWGIFLNELSDVNEPVERAVSKVMKLPPQDRAAPVLKALAAARKGIDGSVLLKDIDRNDVFPVSIVATLRAQIKVVEGISQSWMGH